MIEKEKIKIAFFADVLKENVDGVTYTLYNIIKRIPKDKLDYIFITPYPPENIEDFPFPVIVCPYIKFPLYDSYPLAFPFFSRKLKKILNDYNPDLVHYTTPSFLGRYATKFAMKRNIPLFATYHTHFLSYIEYYLFFKIFGGVKLWKYLTGKVMRWSYNKCDITFVPTEPIREDLVKTGINPESLIIWGRGIDTENYGPQFKDTAFIEKFAGKETRRILFVSRLVWEKDIRTLMKIYDIFQRTRPEIKMILTGDGPKKNAMMKRMPNAIFTGKLIGEDLSKIYASCDLFVFPSITETFGNVVLEALSSGLPSVVAAAGGPKGIVIHGKTGFHSQPKNASDFCDKIVTILDNQILAEQMKQNAIEYAKKQSWDNLCDKMFETYFQILSMNNQSAGIEHENAI